MKINKNKATKLDPWFWQSRSLPEPVTEYQFYESRKWRFDFAWPDKMLALEIEGGLFIHGGHVRGAMYIQNCLKYNEATRLGWAVYRFTPQQLRSNDLCKYPKTFKGKRETTAEFLQSLFGKILKCVCPTA